MKSITSRQHEEHQDSANTGLTSPRSLAILAALTACYSTFGCSAGDNGWAQEGESVAATSAALVNVNNEYLQYGVRANWTAGPFRGDQATFMVDVTGDGKGDAIAVNHDGIFVRRSNGTSFNANEQWTAGAFFGDHATFFADVTGDSKADAIAVNHDGIFVRRSNGTSFNANEQWTTSAFFGDQATFFADVTGDGKADAIAVNHDGIYIRRSSGTSFNANEQWTTGAFFGDQGTFFADVTGDGKADAIAVNHDGIFIRRSNGTSFNANETWATGAFFGSVGTYVVDMTGDGKADVVAVNSDGVFMRRSNGFQFGSTELQADQSSLGVTPALIDVNGDRRADVVEVASDGVQVAASRERVIPVRFVQFTSNGTPVVTSAQLDNVMATANAVYSQVGLRFWRKASDVVTSPELADLSSTTPNTAAALAKAKDSFNSGCNIGDVTTVASETEQLNLVGTRCALADEVLIYIGNTDSGSGGFFPDHGKIIIMATGDITGQNVTNMLLSHELGHFLGLPHAFTPVATDYHTGVSSASVMWDLNYKPVGGSWVSFKSRADAAASEGSLVPIQTSLDGGWWCPSGNVSEPCPAGAPLGYFVLPVKDGNGTIHNVASGDELLKGLAPTLPNGVGTFNVMTYNNKENPSNVQQSRPGLSLSQIEQIRSVLTFNVLTNISTPSGTRIMSDRPSLGR